MGSKVIFHDNGSAQVTLNGLSLVSDVTVTPLSYDATTNAVSASGVQLTPGGEVGGFQAFIAQDLVDTRAALDTLAMSVLAGAVAGRDLGDFFHGWLFDRLPPPLPQLGLAPPG